MDGRHGRGWKDNIKMDLEDAGYEAVEKIDPVLEKVPKNPGYKQTRAGDRSARNHDNIYEIYNSAKDRKQDTENRSTTTSYIILKKLKLFICSG
jgi:hypothetical protein